MPIQLKHIAVKNLGPLPENFEIDLGDVTLFYGYNETGKTFLVEFILKSLFKNIKFFNLRRGNPNGKVLVSGLDKEDVSFSPKSKKKLEDYWEETNKGIPLNIARLLIVKGGELDLDTGKDALGGISINVIREFLSSQGLLDAVLKNIEFKTTREAVIEKGVIIGKEYGDIGRRMEAAKTLENINRLIERFNEFSGSQVISINKQISKLDNKIKILEQAKRHNAFCLDKEIKSLQKNVEQIEDTGFEKTKKNFASYISLKKSVERKKTDKETAQENSQHYDWLRTAILDYEKYFGQGDLRTSPALLIIALFFLVLALIFIFMNISGLAIAGILLGGILGYWYFQKLKFSSAKLAEKGETQQIKKTFGERFNAPFKDLATMKVKLIEIEADHYKAQQLAEDIKKAEGDIKDLEVNIRQGLIGLGLKEDKPSKWGDLIDSQTNKLEGTKKKIQDLENDLARLDVDSSDYVAEEPEIKYSKSEMDTAQNNLSALRDELRLVESSLDSLKSEIRGLVGDHHLEGWENLLQKIREKRLEELEEYRECTTSILAGNLLNQIIDDSRAREDEKIAEGLVSDALKKPIFDITNKYTAVSLDEEMVKIVDQNGEQFDFSELSTGAREQILLALRIGFASRVMQGNTAFLILDDAFQHSDWKRRPRLIDNVLKLAQNGWQIIYFTMDNHIRDLFEGMAKLKFKERYKLIELH